MMAIKPGVRLIGLRPEMAVAISIVGSVYLSQGFDCTITSVVDSKHRPNSLHYKGMAVDFRTRDITPETQKQILVNAVGVALGPEYDAVLEADHLHIEWDPDSAFPERPRRNSARIPPRQDR